MGGKRGTMSNAKPKASAGAMGGMPLSSGGRIAPRNKWWPGQMSAAEDRETLQGLVGNHPASGATVYTEETLAYGSMPFKHAAATHSVGKYMRGQADANCVESFRLTLKHAHKGTFHKLSAKCLNC